MVSSMSSNRPTTCFAWLSVPFRSCSRLSMQKSTVLLEYTENWHFSTNSRSQRAALASMPRCKPGSPHTRGSHPARWNTAVWDTFNGWNTKTQTANRRCCGGGNEPPRRNRVVATGRGSGAIRRDSGNRRFPFESVHEKEKRWEQWWQLGSEWWHRFHSWHNRWPNRWEGREAEAKKAESEKWKEKTRESGETWFRREKRRRRRNRFRLHAKESSGEKEEEWIRWSGFWCTWRAFRRSCQREKSWLLLTSLRSCTRWNEPVGVA